MQKVQLQKNKPIITFGQILSIFWGTGFSTFGIESDSRLRKQLCFTTHIYDTSSKKYGNLCQGHGS